MRQGVVSEIAEVVRKEARQLGKPYTEQLVGTTVLYEPQPDGTWKRTNFGGPGVRPQALALHTLSGLVSYLVSRAAESATEPDSAATRDGAQQDELLIHVVDHEHVKVLTALDEKEGAYRTVFATAEFQPLIGTPAVPFRFGQYLDLESFNIALQALFEDGDDRKRVLHITGTVKEETVRTSKDDGVTQQVVASAGVVGAYDTDVPNPVRLRPFRTFREVPQPESLFILRMKKGATGALPEAALFEADGGAWKLEAIRSIKSYLEMELEGDEDLTILA